MKEATEEVEVQFSHCILNVCNQVTIWSGVVNVFDNSVVFTCSKRSSKNADCNPRNDVIGGDVGFHW